MKRTALTFTIFLILLISGYIINAYILHSKKIQKNDLVVTIHEKCLASIPESLKNEATLVLQQFEKSARNNDSFTHLLMDLNERFGEDPQYPHPYPPYVKQETSNSSLATLPECYHKHIIDIILDKGKTQILDVHETSYALTHLASTEALAIYILDNLPLLRISDEAGKLRTRGNIVLKYPTLIDKVAPYLEYFYAQESDSNYDKWQARDFIHRLLYEGILKPQQAFDIYLRLISKKRKVVSVDLVRLAILHPELTDRVLSHISPDEALLTKLLTDYTAKNYADMVQQIVMLIEDSTLTNTQRWQNYITVYPIIMEILVRNPELISKFRPVLTAMIADNKRTGQYKYIPAEIVLTATYNHPELWPSILSLLTNEYRLEKTFHITPALCQMATNDRTTALQILKEFGKLLPDILHYNQVNVQEVLNCVSQTHDLEESYKALHAAKTLQKDIIERDSNSTQINEQMKDPSEDMLHLDSLMKKFNTVGIYTQNMLLKWIIVRSFHEHRQKDIVPFLIRVAGDSHKIVYETLYIFLTDMLLIFPDAAPIFYPVYTAYSKSEDDELRQIIAEAMFQLIPLMPEKTSEIIAYIKGNPLGIQYLGYRREDIAKLSQLTFKQSTEVIDYLKHEVKKPDGVYVNEHYAILWLLRFPLTDKRLQRAMNELSKISETARMVTAINTAWEAKDEDMLFKQFIASYLRFTDYIYAHDVYAKAFGYLLQQVSADFPHLPERIRQHFVTMRMQHTKQSYRGLWQLGFVYPETTLDIIRFMDFYDKNGRYPHQALSNIANYQHRNFVMHHVLASVKGNISNTSSENIRIFFNHTFIIQEQEWFKVLRHYMPSVLSGNYNDAKNMLFRSIACHAHQPISRQLLTLYYANTQNENIRKMLDAASRFSETETMPPVTDYPTDTIKEGCATGHWSRVGLPPYEELNRLFPKNRLLWEQ